MCVIISITMFRSFSLSVLYTQPYFELRNVSAEGMRGHVHASILEAAVILQRNGGLLLCSWMQEQKL